MDKNYTKNLKIYRTSDDVSAVYLTGCSGFSQNFIRYYFKIL